MKKTELLFLLMFLGGNWSFAQSNKIVGVWLTENKTGKIKIYEQNGKYYGKIIGGDNPDRLDSKNSDKSLRSRKLFGTVILTGLEYDGNGNWRNGKIYDPDNGGTYTCTAWFDGKVLKLRGYWGIFYRTSEWTRIE